MYAVSYDCNYATLQDFINAATLHGAVNIFNVVRFKENEPFTDYGILDVIYQGYMQQVKIALFTQAK
jgi:hypothetical protein